jgi:uncharacterized protein
LLSNIGDLGGFNRLLQLLAANASSTLNMSRFASDIGVSVATIKQWISVLSASYAIFLLQPYYNNLGKRITKAPKVCFYDTGLLAHLTKVNSYEAYENSPMTGRLFENYIVSEVLKKEVHNNTFANLYFYRSSHGVEVDLIVERKNQRELIEIKQGQTFRVKMLDPIKSIMREGDKAFVLYNGKEYTYSDDINVLNFQDYLLSS